MNSIIVITSLISINYLLFQGVSTVPEICTQSANNLSPCNNPSKICTEGGQCDLNLQNETELDTNTETVCPEGQKFDDILEKCVNLIGSNCETHQDCIVSSTCHPEWDSTQHRFQGKCRCGSGNFFENVTTRTCQEKKKFGETCNDLNPCESSSHFLSCQQGTCQCLDSQIQLYDRVKNSCVLKLGQNCYDYRRHMKSICGQNAECVFFFTKRTIPRCKCVKGYVETEDGNCQASYGTRCNSTSICYAKGGLVCSDGICQCDSPLTQVFENGVNKCKKVVGSECTDSGSGVTSIHTNGSEECVANALCKDGECRCGSGYSKSSKRTCKLDYGQRCEWDECNTHAGLACREGICKCFDSQNLQFDTATKVCRLGGLNSKRKQTFCGFITGGESIGEEGAKGSGRIKGGGGSWKYPVRCPKGYECIREGGDVGCSCDVRAHPSHKQQEFCLRDYL